MVSTLNTRRFFAMVSNELHEWRRGGDEGDVNLFLGSHPISVFLLVDPEDMVEKGG